MDILTIDLDWTNLVVEKYDGVEFVVFLQDKKDRCITQDIAIVRQATEDEKPIPGVIECLVWANENTEDYTDKFFINQYREADDG
jgi:hypothetical protein